MQIFQMKLDFFFQTKTNKSAAEPEYKNYDNEKLTKQNLTQHG